MSDNEQVKKDIKPIDSEFQIHSLQIGHLLKYNLYLLTKALVFQTVYSDAESVEEAIKTTENVMGELDLDYKNRNKAEPE
jgi:hypothetical protein